MTSFSWGLTSEGPGVEAGNTYKAKYTIAPSGLIRSDRSRLANQHAQTRHTTVTFDHRQLTFISIALCHRRTNAVVL